MIKRCKHQWEYLDENYHWCQKCGTLKYMDTWCAYETHYRYPNNMKEVK